MKEGTAIVTGGTGGIGRAIVQRLLKDGIRVVIADTDPSGETFASECRLQYGSDSAVYCMTDISDRHGVDSLIELSEQWNDLRYLVNNAVYSEYKPFLEISPEGWEKVLQVGLTGYFHCSQSFALKLADCGRPGRIINMASVNSFVVEKGVAHYAAVKGGILQLTKAMAVDLASFDITVNAVAPGMIETFRNRETFRNEPFTSQIERIPLRRTGRPEEIAEIIRFLLKGEHYINGQTLLADGGMLAGF
ncbi:SDR family NAD(P)-dependent oxidoreductase [Paenibacillus solisilvae]|uniref:SDR family NAD(P)-dependent oxidoreductase n=1 Tax=Paenibacillus solisilvae TaxID=2486751 RepID=A0ABW0VPB1_9BACL